MNQLGFLLVIEGIDGAGKSTLQRALVAWCESQGLTVTSSREPTDGLFGKALRESAKTGRLSIEEELELFLKDRRDHVSTLISPALARGEVVILDRYYFSTAAYQGARGLDPASIIAANEAFAPAPDLVLLLDLPPTSGHVRIGSRGGVPDGFEGVSYLAEVRRIFLSIERPYLRRVDADRPADAVREDCVRELQSALTRRKLLH
jgi:dTMP kinase